MSLVSELTYFLGLHIRQIQGGIFINKIEYVNNIVKKIGLDIATYCHTPIGTHDKLLKDELGTNINHPLYKSRISSLLYLTTSRPEICYSIGVYARCQVAPKESHLLAVKKLPNISTGLLILGYYILKLHNFDFLVTVMLIRLHSDDRIYLYYDNLSAINISK